MYRMILPETLPDVAAAEAHAAAEPGGSVDVPTVDVRAVDADAAAARTRADYGRVSRWALGLLGTAGAAVAVLIAVFPLSLVGTAGTGQVLFGAVFVAIALAIGIPSVWLLWALHRSGRRLSRAAGYWAGLPYRQCRRSPTRGDWFAVRFLGRRPRHRHRGAAVGNRPLARLEHSVPRRLRRTVLGGAARAERLPRARPGEPHPRALSETASRRVSAREHPRRGLASMS